LERLHPARTLGDVKLWDKPNYYIIYTSKLQEVSAELLAPSLRLPGGQLEEPSHADMIRKLVYAIAKAVWLVKLPTLYKDPIKEIEKLLPKDIIVLAFPDIPRETPIPEHTRNRKTRDAYECLWFEEKDMKHVLIDNFRFSVFNANRSEKW